ncbi:MAG: NAD-dependent epimerase/dehydratase family protein, partial [Planctomycetota bacterium]
MSGFWENKSCLVTGATGFLGGFLVRSLLDQGAEVVALVRDHIPHAQFHDDDILSQVKIIYGAIEDERTVARAINEYACDTVFHLAAQAIVGVANREPVATFKANIEGTWVVLEACRQIDTVERVIIASSDKAYG